MLRSLVLRSIIFLISSAILLTGHISSATLNIVITVFILGYYLLNIINRASNVPLVHSIVRLCLTLCIIGLVWYTFGCILALISTISDLFIFDTVFMEGPSDSPSGSPGPSPGPEGNGSPPDPSSGSSSGSEGSGSTGDDGRDGSGGEDDEDEPDRHSAIALCTHRYLSPYEYDPTTSDIEETTCDFNPTRMPDGSLQSHNAFTSDGYSPVACPECHAIMCMDCANMDQPTPTPSPPDSKPSYFDKHGPDNDPGGSQGGIQGTS